MCHPNIDGDPVAVPKSAVPHYTGGGWEECEPPPPRVRPSKNTTSTRSERRRTPRSSKED